MIKQRMEHLTDEELEDLICELEAAGFYRRQLIGLTELQERRKADSAEPVAWTDEQELRDVEKDGCGYLFKANPISPNADPRRVIKLYRHAQPAQVVPDERTAFNEWNKGDDCPLAGRDAKSAAWLAWQVRAALCGNSMLNVPPERPADSSNGDDVEAWFDEGWNACRAAMLQGAEPVTQHDELPLDYLQGHKDGLEWAAQLAEANHPQTGDWLYDDPIELAKAIRKGPDMPEDDGNSPVIGFDPASGPDRSVKVRYFSLPGYSVVPIAPTQEMAVAGGDTYVRSEDVNQYPTDAARRIWAAMVAAAPMQEVKKTPVAKEIAMGARFTDHRFKV